MSEVKEINKSVVATKGEATRTITYSEAFDQLIKMVVEIKEGYKGALGYAGALEAKIKELEAEVETIEVEPEA